jgi:hypothetical protein
VEQATRAAVLRLHPLARRARADILSAVDACRRPSRIRPSQWRKGPTLRQDGGEWVLCVVPTAVSG